MLISFSFISETHASNAWVFVFLDKFLTNFFVYLDEFGHEGPFISKFHERHNTSPVFGIGGFWLPLNEVRKFTTWFYSLKCRLLSFEIERDNTQPYTWEKKAQAFTQPSSGKLLSDLISTARRMTVSFLCFSMKKKKAFDPK